MKFDERSPRSENARMLDAATILANCRFFSKVTEPSRGRLLEMSVVRQFQAGEVVFRQGEKCPGVYIVGSGLVRVYKLAPSGKEHVLHLVPPGGTFAEVAAIGRFSVPAFSQAIEDATCLLLPADPFSAALSEDHQLCLQLMGSMAGWVRHLLGLLEDVVLRDAVGRVASYLLTSAQQSDDRVQLPGLKKHLASHLNLTSETLSRTLRRLLDSGVIAQAPDEGLIIEDRDSLQAAADGDFPQI